eukprot:GABV01008111.1.p2 GENE.GABV01008111.1~~GABV01008111.1.p2  ORF type:complete len:111 (-),score=43.19 GABV01008111.1:11-343(-)
MTIGGYYANAQATEERFDGGAGGWFRTGDIVKLEGPRKIRIIDRLKNIFKLSQGEFVAPEKLEGAYEACDLVHRCFVTCADTFQFEQHAPVAVVVPSESVVRAEANTRGY